ncbi:MAG: hypothetical protein CTY31_13790 [Hyphomicrobium sp.]|nr:MAG: hypothetical protein CTY39_07555 [Hyphomicrobium sp.]PPC98270.1 MAG: hypothetical protein CTY31_13790 [Hyphomicrobium sp.]
MTQVNAAVQGNLSLDDEIPQRRVAPALQLRLLKIIPSETIEESDKRFSARLSNAKSGLAIAASIKGLAFVTKSGNQSNSSQNVGLNYRC